MITAFRLAALSGDLTVLADPHLLLQLPADTLFDWHDYFRIDPDFRADLRAGRQIQLLANINKKKNARPIRIDQVGLPALVDTAPKKPMKTLQPFIAGLTARAGEGQERATQSREDFDRLREEMGL